MDRPSKVTTARTTARTRLRVERIRVKTRLAKVLGEAVTVPTRYEDIYQSRHRTAVGHETPGHGLSF